MFIYCFLFLPILYVSASVGLHLFCLITYNERCSKLRSGFALHGLLLVHSSSALFACHCSVLFFRRPVSPSITPMARRSNKNCLIFTSTASINRIRLTFIHLAQLNDDVIAVCVIAFHFIAKIYSQNSSFEGKLLSNYCY